MILTLLGMWWRIIEINMLENAVTSVTASVMTTAVSSLVVTASAEHTPSTCSVIGLLANSGPISTFLTSFSSPVSAIIQRSFTYILQEGTKAQFTHPEIKAVLHTVRGERGTGKAINGKFIAGTRAPFHHLQRRLAVVVEHFFTNKLCPPVRVLNFTPQPWCFALIVISNAFHRTTIGIQRHKGVHH